MKNTTGSRARRKTPEHCQYCRYDKTESQPPSSVPSILAILAMKLRPHARARETVVMLDRTVELHLGKMG